LNSLEIAPALISYYLITFLKRIRGFSIQQSFLIYIPSSTRFHDVRRQVATPLFTHSLVERGFSISWRQATFSTKYPGFSGSRAQIGLRSLYVSILWFYKSGTTITFLISSH
jgi:hypothetical protein